MTYYERYNKQNDYGTGELYMPVEMHVLETICDNPGITVTACAKLRNRTRSAISQCIKKLEAKGLIIKTPQANNKKNIALWATDAGKKLTKLHIAFDNTRFQEFFGILPNYYSPKELNAFFSVMETALFMAEEDQRTSKE